ncbi:hypothetical protein FisN_8Hh180 [Fistulifera solaris]|jgi:hypothetical protein|uniref:Uncharacterized protein n=1 Tax=Fistulifera solaris TaxID=1519565 RepID=A0A1Z5JY69_FISSO|nr:hypothetical protein FisN_8Hh180 [Fistulifera solaris]|eukprot:GAX18960.1 hypothetical protein FisN_8Hh180 [Fistulifera solaris]
MNPLAVSSFDFGSNGSDAGHFLGVETTTNIGNFDVLLTGDSAHNVCLLQDRMHVGNNRFQVLVTMNAKQYAENVKLGAQSDPVVDRIIDIVCRQVVPNGRFLVKNHSSWIVLSRENAKVFVQRQLNAIMDGNKPKSSIQEILSPPAPPPSQAPAQSTLTSGPSSTYMHSSVGGPSVQMHVYNSSHYGMRSSMQNMLPAVSATPVTSSHIDFRNSMPAMVNATHALNLEDDEDLLLALEPVPIGENITIIDGDGEKKRRRRSSLLRRSASESLLSSNANSTDSFDFDHKKSLRKHSLMDPNAFSSSSFFDLLEAEQESLGHEDPFLDEILSKSESSINPIREKRRSGRHDSFTSFLKRSDSFEAPRSNVVTTAEPLDVIFQNVDQRKPNSTLFSLQQHTGNNRLNVYMSMQMERYKKSSHQERKEIVLQMQDTVLAHWGGRFLMETPEPGYQVLTDSDTVVMLLGAFDERAGTSTPLTSENEPSFVDAVGGFQKMPAVPSTATSVHDVQLRSQALESLQKRKKRIGLASKIRNLAASTRSALTRSKSEPSRELSDLSIDETQYSTTSFRPY